MSKFLNRMSKLLTRNNHENEREQETKKDKKEIYEAKQPPRAPQQNISPDLTSRLSESTAVWLLYFFTSSFISIIFVGFLKHEKSVI